jgi:hypothetical protein
MVPLHIFEGFMKEEWLDPTEVNIRQWAANPDSLWPNQEWDYDITGLGFEDLFLELVEDEKCSKADFFLHCLYLWVYQSVGGSDKQDELERLLRHGEASREAALRIWTRHSRALFRNPKRAGKHIWWGFGQGRTET